MSRHRGPHRAAAAITALLLGAATLVAAPGPAAGAAPGPDTTGAPDDGTLQVLAPGGTAPYPADLVAAGTLYVRTPGARYHRWRFDVDVVVAAPGVVFTESRFRGGPLPGAPSTALLAVAAAGPAGPPSAVVQDSTIRPRAAGSRADGVRGSNFTLRRVEITGTVDGVHIHGRRGEDPRAGNVVVADSWIHDLVYYRDDPLHPDGTHNDGVQIVGGRDILLQGNRIDGALRNAALMVTQRWNPVSGLRVAGNVLGSGACSINIADLPGSPAIGGLVITGNTFLRTQSVTGCAATISRPTRDAVAAAGNTWDDGSPATVVRGSGPAAPAPPRPAGPAPRAPAAGDVVWLPGPWPERQVAGYPVLLPASAALGPLHPRPGGWASGYTADPAAAAIAALRAQLLLIAAPPALLPAIAAAVAAPASVPAITAGQAGLPRNTRPDWALPPRIADTLPPGELALLGATATPAGPGTADVDTWHRYTTPGDQPEVLWLRSTTRMRHHDGEWRADPPDPDRQNIPADAPPTAYTIPGPDGAAP